MLNFTKRFLTQERARYEIMTVLEFPSLVFLTTKNMKGKKWISYPFEGIKWTACGISVST